MSSTQQHPPFKTFSLSSELKIRARLLLNALQSQDPSTVSKAVSICQFLSWPIPEKWSLRHTLNIVAHQAGFKHYQHARTAILCLTTMQVQAQAGWIEQVLNSFISAGRLNKIPQMRKKRAVILSWLVTQLEPDRRYREAELNQFLLAFHEDYATLRREFIACKLMARENAVYWRI